MSDENGLYSAITYEISVSVQSFYLEEESNPEENHYVWAYHVEIENLGDDTVTLQSRHWQITDANGKIEEVHGEGVVGEQPILGPGDAFEYTSGAPLVTSSGIMMGSYHMKRQDGSHFDVEIPAFSLDYPYGSPVIH